MSLVDVVNYIGRQLFGSVPAPQKELLKSTPEIPAAAIPFLSELGIDSSALKGGSDFYPKFKDLPPLEQKILAAVFKDDKFTTYGFMSPPPVVLVVELEKSLLRGGVFLRH